MKDAWPVYHVSPNQRFFTLLQQAYSSFFLKQIISQSHCKPPVTLSILITPCKSTWYIVF